MDDAVATPRRALILGGEADLVTALRAALSSAGVEVDADPSPPTLDVLVVVAAPAPSAIAGSNATALDDGLGRELRLAYSALRRGVAAIRAKGGGGAVVFVAPPSPAQRSFDALRQGLRLLTRSAALELGPEGIRVNIVLPDEGESPLGRALTAADIAASVAFAASPRAHFMTGADLVVDGGRMAA